MNQYFEQMILSASPVEIVNLLYQKAIRSLRNAREHLLTGRILDRTGAVNDALAVISELVSSLDFEAAPDLSRQLRDLYVYMQGRLAEANMKQEEAPLSEVLMLLSTLGEGWAGLVEKEKKRMDPPAWVTLPAGDDQLSRFGMSA